MVQRSPVYPPSLSPPVKTYIIMVQNQNQETGLGTLCVYSFLTGCYRCRCLKALLPSRCRMLHHCKDSLLFPLTVAPPPTPDHWFVFHVYIVVILKMLCKLNHIVCGLLRLYFIFIQQNSPETRASGINHLFLFYRQLVLHCNVNFMC